MKVDFFMIERFEGFVIVFMEINFVDGCCNLRMSVVCPKNMYNFNKNKYLSFDLSVFN